MAIPVQQLFDDILIKYNNKILTSGCWDKLAGWVHYQEDKDFVKFLHGGELILNSTVRFMPEDEKREFILGLIESGAAGCVIATESEAELESILELCEEHRFPLIWSDYSIPFLDIIHDLTEVLVYEERNAINREVALRNLILYRGKDEVHEEMLRTDPYLAAGSYTILLIGREGNVHVDKAFRDLIEKEMRVMHPRYVVCEEGDNLVMLAADSNSTELVNNLEGIRERLGGNKIAIGSTVAHISGVFESYKTARVALRMIPVMGRNPLSYTDLGIYKVLDDVQKGNNIDNFVEKTLGKLIRYDDSHGTNYVEILRMFMKNECNVIQTADALFFHRNTMQKKIANIKDILGYDILLNENRFRIILAMYLLKMKNS